MRVSDTERQRVIEELRRHCAAGRLDVDEYSARIESALGATTLEQLDEVLGDLPLMRIADPAGSARYGARSLGTGDGETSSGRSSRLSADGAVDSGIVKRLAATALVLASVIVVLVAVTLVLVAGWAWALVLVAGWLIGLAQGRLSRRRR